MNSISKYLAALLMLLTCGFGSGQAQSVYFPSLQQPGKSVGQFDGTTCTLANDMFTAQFVKNGGSISFGGCPEMGLQPGTDLFKITLGDGTTVTDKQMTLGNVSLETLTGDETAVKGSHRFDGYAFRAVYTYRTMTLVWSAVLRDGSHYLRTKLDVTTSENIATKNLIPMIYKVDKKVGGQLGVVGNTRGAVLASDKLFAGLETPMGINQVVDTDGQNLPTFVYNQWKTADFQDIPDEKVPAGVIGLKTITGSKGSYGPNGKSVQAKNVVAYSGQLNFPTAGEYKVTFQYTTGNHRLNLVGVDLLDANGTVAVSDYHAGFTGTDTYKNVYTLNVETAGVYTVRYLVETLTETVLSDGQISYSKPVSGVADITSEIYEIQGLWKRNTTLLKDDPNVKKLNEDWSISAVVGFVAPGQARRSFLAYSERERAVPWRPMPIYNSWYELNIDRNNAPQPENNMTTAQTAPILEAWKTNLFENNGVGIKSFVWDDGWDNYQTWECHNNFDFAQPSATAKSMGAGTGVWLGPVGGYGKSGDTRRAYWKTRGGMELSNPDYYRVFLNAVSNMVVNYNDNYFKLDGISAQPSAVGPDNDATGDEDAEAVIALENEIRRSYKKDIFFNTSVGTWASPFWFRFTDAVWRQEGDYGEAGDNTSDREKWITYRDRLVYQNFVQNSPLCPINTMMVHGIILTTYGDVSKDMNREGIIREMRCAFASGNAMVELYCDHALLTQYNLWGELADCIRWQERNADVLPDIHWVGGNPWDGANENVYGWASWNGKKATFALRNGDTQEKTFVTTLRDALEIPAYVKGTMSFQPSFSGQATLDGFTVGAPIDIDTPLSLTLPASSVFAFDGEQEGTVPNVPLTVTVHIRPEHKYGTCILPFDAPLPKTMRAYSCASSNGDVLILKEETSLAANTPYILYAYNGAYTEFHGLTPAEIPAEMTAGYLTGVLKDKVLNVADDCYVLQHHQDQGVRFYLVNTQKTLPAYKCFLKVPGGQANAFRFEGDATGISAIFLEKNEAPIYDLSGRRVWRTLPGHIYLSNGRKFMAK